jgi:hypothetical protein
MTEELVKYETGPRAMSLPDVMIMGKAMVESGLFPDIKSQAQAVVKILAGQEVGVGPFASMSGIHIIQGKAEYGAHILAAVLRRSGIYTYRVRQPISDDEVSIEFFERNGDKWESLGTSAFTQADAKRQGTKNMDRFPRNMLWARAMTNGIAWYCPEVAMVRMYGEGEIGSASILEQEPQRQSAPVERKPQAQLPEQANGRPWSGEQVYAYLEEQAAKFAKETGDTPASKALCQMVAASLDKALGDRDRRVKVTEAVFGFESTGKATADGFESYMTTAQGKAVLTWLGVSDGGYAPAGPYWEQEAANLYYTVSEIVGEAVDDEGAGDGEPA